MFISKMTEILLVDEIHGKREDGTVQIRVDGALTGKRQIP